MSAGAGAGSAFVPRGAATMCGSPRTQAEERVGSDDDRMEGHRLHWARRCAACALWCLPALALTLPKGLLPFGLLLLVSTLLVPGVVAGARRIGWPLAAVAATALLAMGVALLSSHWAGGGGIESRDRLLVLPWTMAWAWALRPPASWLWRGAMAGLACAVVLAFVQVATGLGRASGWVNAIVFADVVLLLMVLAVFCRPPRSWHWAVFGVVCGTVAILFSGTRGTWPGLLLLLAAVVLGSGWQSWRYRVLLLATGLAGVVALVGVVPGMSHQMRLVELQQDIERIDAGDHDSSAGARLERLQVAVDAFLERPWTGVGFAQFDRAMREQLPACREPHPAERCDLGHAHNDLAEWAATMGIPGVVSLLLLYGVPLALFLHLAGHTGVPRMRGIAAGGAMLVVVFALCGLTQSMFAHQTTTSAYAALTGILLGLALHEAAAAGRLRGRGVRGD